MKWLDSVWFTCLSAVAGVIILSVSVWLASGPAKSDTPAAWLVPTVIMLDGSHVTGAHGWHPRKYPSMIACRKQMALARIMTPPQGADAVAWQCLTYNPMEGRGA